MQSKEFVHLIEQNQGIIHKVCRMYCDDVDDRADLFQEVLYQLWKSMDSFQQKSKVTTWMYKVAIYTALTYVKKNRTPYDKDSEMKTELQLASLPERYQEEDYQLLHKAISRLEKIDRAIVLLYLEEHSYRVIGELMGITESNVGARINRIKAKLKSLMQHG